MSCDYWYYGVNMRTAFSDITYLTYICIRITLIITLVLDHKITNTSLFCNFWTAIRDYIWVIFVLRFMVTLFHTITTIWSINHIYIIRCKSHSHHTSTINTITGITTIINIKYMLTQWNRNTFINTSLQWSY